MAFVPQRQCTRVGCRALVKATDPGAPRCPQHPYPTRKPITERQPDTRPNASRRGYDWDWRRLRTWYLVRHPICEIRIACDGRPATEVDHKVPLRSGGLRLDQGNLQATCRACHRAKTIADQRGNKA